MDKGLHCTNCIYEDLCTPFEKLLYICAIIDEEDECKCFININEFDNNYANGNTEYVFQEYIWQEMDGEPVWKEMSWNRYKDNLFNYIEDDTL